MHLPRVQRWARSFAKAGIAEFDDLVQEGLLKVFLLLRDDQPVSNTAIKNAMRNWLRFCYRKGFADTMTEEDLDYKSGIHSAPGRRKTFWQNGEEAEQGGWTNLGYVPEPA